MSLGLIARDSIGDLTAFSRDDLLGLGDAALSSSITSTSSGDTNVFHNDQVTTTTPLSSTGSSNKLSVTTGGDSTTRIPSKYGGNTTTRSQQQIQRQSLSQQQKEANPQQPPSLFQFVDYYNDAYYTNYMNDHIDNDHHDHHATSSTDNYHHQESNFVFLGHSRSSDNRNHFLCCLFPWLQPSPASKKLLHNEAAIQQQPASSTSVVSATSSSQLDTTTNTFTSATATTVDTDETSNNSNLLGERLSDRERQAVLARLRLVQPETKSIATISTISEHQNTTGSEPQSLSSVEAGDKNKSVGSLLRNNNKGLLNGIPVYDTSPLDDNLGNVKAIKGILKNRSLSKVSDDSESKTLATIGEKITRSSLDQNQIPPSINGGTTTPPNVRRRSLFPSYEEKKPRNSMNSVSFSPMARVVTVKSKNDMTFDEKSDVWWQKSDYEDFRKTGRIITKAMLEGGGEIWLAGDKKDSSKSATTVSDSSSNANDKWWHKFGHSRRGLEHVVSIEEGRQRQMNVKNAIRAVLDEQARQKMYKKVDPEKLRHVALQHTMWARDLALASGASDADAVDQSFSEGRKSREFFLLKMSRNKTSQPLGGSVKVEPKNIPLFMQPSQHVQRPTSSRMNGGSIPSHQLDAHTASQIQFRRQKLHSSDPTTSISQQQATTSLPRSDNGGAGVESQEQVHDPDNNNSTTTTVSLAQKAAGFVADDREKVNMAAVLSGMGGTVMISNTKTKNDTTALPTIMRVAS